MIALVLLAALILGGLWLAAATGWLLWQLVKMMSR